MQIIKSDYIRDKLSYIESKVKNDTKQKLYDINTTAEYIFMNILNDVYDWKLVNANDIKPNFPAIDLIDTTNEIIIQVTSSIDDSKVTSTIEKFRKFADDNYKNGEYKIYADYQLKMFYIKDKPKKFSKATETKIENQNMSDNDFLGIEDINTIVSANPTISTKVFKTLCKIFHDKVCDTDILPNLTIKSSTNDSSFIGRENELKAIDEILESSNSLLLINGIGGIGKSSLANYYLYTREKNFDYYGFIDGLDSFTSEFRNSLDLKTQKEEELYREIIFKLQRLQGKKLLVIDNVEDIETHKNLIEMILSLHKFDYKILFTSRRKIKNIESYPLGTLLPHDAQKLFLNCFKKEEERERINKNKVNKVIEYLGLHTLFIKLVAETIENEGYSLDDIIEKFENGELSKIEFIDENSGEEVTFNQNLQELFSMQNLNDGYVLLLKRLSVLPSIDIKLSFLEEILGKERLQEGKLNFLVNHGWLIENKGTYKLHQIIKEFLLANHTPAFKETTEIWNYLKEIIKNNNSYTTIINNIEKFKYFDSFLQFLIKIKLINKEIADFIINVSNLYNILGEYKKAENILIKAIDFGEKTDYNISSYHHNLASIYIKMGKYQKSEFFFIKALEIEKKTDNEAISFAETYSSLGTLYNELNKYSLAIYYYKESIEFLKKYNFKDVSLQISTIYNQLGQVYLKKEDYPRAELYLKESLKIKRELNCTLSLAITCKNCAKLYFNLVQIEKAYLYLKEAIEIEEKIFPKDNKDLIDSKEDLEYLKKILKSQPKNYLNY